MSEIERYNRFIDKLFQGSQLYDFKDKELCNQRTINYMLLRTQSMFKYKNLPDTILERNLELYLQTTGHCIVYEYEGNLYVFNGHMGGELDNNFIPTRYVFANPYFNISKDVRINEECVLCYNDNLFIGLLPLMNKYSSILTENELSMRIAIINTRLKSLVSASDDTTFASALKLFEDMENGELGVISTNEFLQGFMSQPYGQSNNTQVLTDLIETEQYAKASFFNEIGLNANYNMKRESLNSSESQLNNDALLPLIDHMLKCRETFVEKINEMYGTNIEVMFASSWEDNEIETELEQGNIEPISEESTKEENEETGDDEK